MIYLDNIDNEIKKEILVSLKEIVTKYPKLNNSISLVSDINYLVNYISNTYTLKDNEKYEPSLKTVFTTASMWLPKDNKKLGLYDSILYYKPDFIFCPHKSFYRFLQQKSKLSYWGKLCWKMWKEKLFFYIWFAIIQKVTKRSKNLKERISRYGL